MEVCKIAIGRSAAFSSKCAINRLAAALCPDPLRLQPSCRPPD